MKASIRLVALAFTAVALAAPIGAQGRSSQRGGGRAAAPRGEAFRGSSAPRGQGGYRGGSPAPRGYSTPRGYSAPRGYAASPRGYTAPRGNMAPRGGYGGNYGTRNGTPGGNGYRAPQDFNGRNGYHVPVAEHGRPLITRGGGRGGGYGRAAFGGERGFRGGRDFDGHREFRGGRWFYGDRPFPIGWESRVVFGGFFPIAYAGYCDAVPYDYDYLLPPMAPSYDPCLFGDRIVVFDRFSRSIVFVATL